MGKSRGRVIDEDVMEVVLHILEKWKGRLTWDTLIAAIKASIATEYTRQALSKHDKIASAFVLRKASLASEECRPASKDTRVNILQDKLNELKSENVRLTAECNAYRAKFIRWTANALKRNITSDQLDTPLIPVHRGRTER